MYQFIVVITMMDEIICCLFIPPQWSFALTAVMPCTTTIGCAPTANEVFAGAQASVVHSDLMAKAARTIMQELVERKWGHGR